MTDLSRVHLIGIGGAGMSGIARVLLARGAAVSGSDAKDSKTIRALEAMGADVHVGHLAANLGAAEVVIVSTAIGESNAELREARRRGVEVLPRAGALALLMAGSLGVAVAGTHGKTTTTSMITVMLQHCGADPSFAIGGDLNEAGSNAHQGTGHVFVAEADESDGSFLLLSPQVAVVTNVEADHLDHYADETDYAAAFEQFVGRLDPTGFLVSCADDPGARRLTDFARATGLAVHTYGRADDADLRVDALRLEPGGGLTFSLVVSGRRLGRVTLPISGAHNALNAAAALSAGLGLGFAAGDLREGLARFTGVRRRLEEKGTAAGVRVIDSYAHHQSEIAADLATGRQLSTSGRLIVVFQPHRYSRTEAFASALGASLAAADEVVVMAVYGAGEAPVPGVTGESVADAIPLPDALVHHEPSWLAVPDLVVSLAAAGDLVMTLGAGDVTLIGPEVLRLLGEL